MRKLFEKTHESQYKKAVLSQTQNLMKISTNSQKLL